MRASILLWTAVLATGLSACSNLPSSPSQPARFDLGPVQVATASAPAKSYPVLALADIQARAQNENSTSVLYRLAYADAHAQHAYAYARWSQPPAVLVQQRLRDILGQDRTVLSAERGAQAPQVQGQTPPVLQLALEEFEQVFTSSTASVGALRLRATLIDPRRGGDVLLGQRLFALQQPASAANAAAGAQALAQAVDQAGLQLQQWLAQLPAKAP
ncbi:MAG: ABC-type transport auxiliary lipoprotein family protein [Comamonas sp.]